MRIVDFHTHILPRVDHGSDSIDTSLKQLAFAKEAKIDSIISTSHFYPHRHDALSFVKRRNEAYDMLLSHTKMPDIDVRLGAEVLLCAGIERLPNLDLLCFQGTKILLIELPFSDFVPEYADSVKNLCDNGYEVILAHADRYPSAHIEELLFYGAKIQLNADSLSCLIKNKTLYDWLERDLVVGIGSDIHMRDKKAYKHFLAARKRIGEDFCSAVMKKSEKIFNMIKK